ncbi:MAG: phospholipid-binding protein [Deltaproteobacteria bacterium]|nr:phospholipid-binding protein [Deltaproteobacteria bacterium]
MPAYAGEFSISFDWGDIPLCTSGSPNVVPNPRFVLSNVPEGTKFIEFTMTDLDVPSYNHGGGTIEYKGDDIIEPGAFTYKSPCPPGGSHRYEWTAKAKEKKGFFSGSIGKAKAVKTYP